MGTPRSATVTILDNDPEDTPTLPLVSVFDASVDEGPDAVLAFPVRLNVAAVETATIEWETRDLSAKAGQDYKGASGTLVFSPGETVKTVRVEVIDDAQVEGTEVMLLLLTDVEGAVIDGESAVGTIKDNDAASDAASDAADDALEDALAVVDGLTPDVAAAVLLGEQTLGEAELAALDRLGNGNGRYDLGDLLSWIDRCRRGEAHCGRTSTDSGPAAAALLGAAAAGGRSTPRRPGRRDSGRRGARIDRRHSPSGANSRTGPRHPARGHHGLVVHRREFGGTGRLRAGSGLPDGRVEWAGSESRCRRSARVGRSHNRRRAGSRSRVVRIQRARTAPDRRGGIPPGGSPRAVPGPGPGPAASVPGPRPRGRGRGLRAQGRRGVPGRDHAALTTPAKMGPPTCAARFECVGGATPTAAGARAGVARPGLLRAAPSSACLTGRMAPGWPVEPASQPTLTSRPAIPAPANDGSQPL